MGLLRIKLTDTNVFTSYMGGEARISPMSDAWLSILNSLLFGGDTIEVTDERNEKMRAIKDMTFTYDTDTAERIRPQDEEYINPLYDLDPLLDFLENNPDELERLTKLINKKK